MLCPSCGHQNRQNARFCDNCSAPLSQGNQASNKSHWQPPFGTQNTSPGGLGWQSPTSVNRPTSAFTAQQLVQPPTPANSIVLSQQRDKTFWSRIGRASAIGLVSLMIVVTITGSFFGLRRRTRTVAQIMGVARNVKLDSQSEPKWRGGTPYTEYTYILRFRVEQYDESGNRVRIVAVEMRASSFEGFINEGDRVEVFGQWTGGLLQAEEIRDHTTGVGFALPKRR